MITIPHKETGAVLLEVAADTLAGVGLQRAVLLYADLRRLDLREADLRGAGLCQSERNSSGAARGCEGGGIHANAPM
jgi:uncharacterized protein YjbI with pentapeptide repeats